jgi:hypothetical protein
MPEKRKTCDTNASVWRLAARRAECDDDISGDVRVRGRPGRAAVPQPERAWPDTSVEPCLVFVCVCLSTNS